MLTSTTNQIIPIDRLRSIAPAIFAEAPHQKLSDNYKFIPTIEVIHAIADLGYYPVWARQTRAREGNRETTKHLIRFRHESHTEINRFAHKGDQYPEIVMVNSHNGASTYRLAAGIFRVVCENGMIVASEDLGDIRLRHMSSDADFFDRVKKVSCKVVENADLGLKQLEEWKQIPLSPSEIVGYGEGVKRLLDLSAVQTESLVAPRRYEDRIETNLYGAFQIVQENIVKGGVRSITDKGKVRKTSAIRSVDKDVKMNQALWHFTQACAESKV